MASEGLDGLLPIANAPGVRGSRKRTREEAEQAEEAEEAAEADEGDEGDEDDEGDEGDESDAGVDNAEDDDADYADERKWPTTRRRPINWTESDPFIKGVFAVSNRNRVRDVHGRIRQATINPLGYRVAVIANQRWLHHRMVYFLWYGQRPDGEIDHRNAKRSDNRPENLEDVTGAENMRRSWANRRRTGSKNWSKSIVGVHGSAEPREFASATVAANVLHLTHTNIIACCLGRLRTVGGWVFTYQQQPDLDGEVWKPIQGIEVSNLGRLLMARTSKHYPNPNPEGYCCIGLKGHCFQFHRLVCQAFHGKPPTGYHADHIDNNPRNNTALNLQWLSPADNTAKKRHLLKKSTRREITTSIGGCYASLTDASKATGVHKSRIVKLCNTGKQHPEHGLFSYVHVLAAEGEIFKNITEAGLVALGRESGRAHLTIN